MSIGLALHVECTEEYEQSFLLATTIMTMGGQWKTLEKRVRVSTESINCIYIMCIRHRLYIQFMIETDQIHY